MCPARHSSFQETLRCFAGRAAKVVETTRVPVVRMVGGSAAVWPRTGPGSRRSASEGLQSKLAAFQCRCMSRCMMRGDVPDIGWEIWGACSLGGDGVGEGQHVRLGGDQSGAGAAAASFGHAVLAALALAGDGPAHVARPHHLRAAGTIVRRSGDRPADDAAGQRRARHQCDEVGAERHGFAGRRRALLLRLDESVGVGVRLAICRGVRRWCVDRLRGTLVWTCWRACAADADSAGAVACALWDCGAVDASGAAGVAAAVVVSLLFRACRLD